MPIARFITAFQRLARRPETVLDGLPSPENLRRILDRERARSDRTGEPLSLVTFAPRSAEAEAETPLLVARILAGRMRTTDVVGWLEGRRIAVVLPTTPAAGAWKVADDVCVEFPKEVPPPICTVYTYPHEWPSHDVGIDSPDGSRSLPATISVPLPGGEWTNLWPDREADHDARKNGQNKGNGRRTRSANGPRAVRGLEQLLVRPMPLWKRAIDIICAAAALTALLPLFAVIAVVVKVTSPGPIIFGQRRTGRGGVPFVMFKFRTMVVDAEARKSELIARNEQDGPAFKLRDDPRLIRFGRFLRRSSLDELPQLVNVLLGQMSLVGPRPLPCNETRACEAWHRQRLAVTPGLTCIWQVKGRSRVTFAEWVRMDVRYIRSRSVLQDMKLLASTVPAVVLGKGV
jgi:lipopolysaccharide/colanic/teichoic acid biosynthesis glycosyltransferase